MSEICTLMELKGGVEGAAVAASPLRSEEPSKSSRHTGQEAAGYWCVAAAMACSRFSFSSSRWHSFFCLFCLWLRLQ